MVKTVITKTGKEMHYLDGKLISKARADELKGDVQTIDAPSTDVTTISKAQAVCLFCGEPATHERLVRLRTISLCASDYINKTTGEIGERINGQIG